MIMSQADGNSIGPMSADTGMGVATTDDMMRETVMEMG